MDATMTDGPQQETARTDVDAESQSAAPDRDVAVDRRMDAGSSASQDPAGNDGHTPTMHFRMALPPSDGTRKRKFPSGARAGLPVKPSASQTASEGIGDEESSSSRNRTASDPMDTDQPTDVARIDSQSSQEPAVGSQYTTKPPIPTTLPQSDSSSMSSMTPVSLSSAQSNQRQHDPKSNKKKKNANPLDDSDDDDHHHHHHHHHNGVSDNGKDADHNHSYVDSNLNQEHRHQPVPTADNLSADKSDGGVQSGSTNTPSPPHQALAPSDAPTATGIDTTVHPNNPLHERHPHQQVHQSSNAQPKGWRVKLYRLNGDGSWDDCGTGRILCLYKRSNSINGNEGNAARDIESQASGLDHNPPSSPLPKAPAPTSTALPEQVNDSYMDIETWIYRKLGEPTLCMQSEASAASSSHAKGDNSQQHPPPPTSRILLRTRILLHGSYQRQGENIITWCEPYMQEGNPSAKGVDLALSFQDNSGCLDIWRQITSVQSRAGELAARNTNEPGGSRDGTTLDGRNGMVRNDDSSSIHRAYENNAPGAADNDRDAGTPNRPHHARGIPMLHGAPDVVDGPSVNGQGKQEIWLGGSSQPNTADTGQQRQPQRQHPLHVNHHQRSMMNHHRHHQDSFEDTVGGMVAAYHESGPTDQGPQLPNPPKLGNLEEIADTIAAVQSQHVQQRENLAVYIAQNDCSYLKSLLSLFPTAESRGDYESLATLAACVKTILLLNDPSIIDLIVTDELIFEEICSTLEYDPDLRDKANHRWFLRERAKFRTVVLMEDEDLIAAIHRSFRVAYLRDTLLRPTMDESSLSTLSSLQTFTHGDVVKGVTITHKAPADGNVLQHSYFAQVIRVLRRETEVICQKEWQALEDLPDHNHIQHALERGEDDVPIDVSTVVASGKYPQAQERLSMWKQHLAPQDDSLHSCKIRRRGSLSFLRELFTMVRTSLQQTDKEDFFAAVVTMDIDEYSASQSNDAASDTTTDNHGAGYGSADGDGMVHVRLLSLLASILADPITDVTEKGAALEIIGSIATHEPGHIRRHCIEYFMSLDRLKEKLGIGYERPRPNWNRQVLFHCLPHDLLASLLYLLAVETDAGILLQVSEILRAILDTDMMGDHGPVGGGFADESEGIPLGAHSHSMNQHSTHPHSMAADTDQKKFLSIFYDHYIEWLAAPFQHSMLYYVRRIPDKVYGMMTPSKLFMIVRENFEKGVLKEEPLVRGVAPCAIRSSFAVELLSFCVRMHVYRMKTYLLRSTVLSNVLNVLRPTSDDKTTSGDRCLKLAALRFLRAVLSVNDDMYHRHIIQHNLFEPVFQAFRANPVGDNLVSSAIVEMCDFIHNEKIVPLVEHLVTKHLDDDGEETLLPSLEDVSSPYVTTLTVLRKAYEADQAAATTSSMTKAVPQGGRTPGYFDDGQVAQGSSQSILDERAREDQRKFREVDNEESYFDTDDDDDDAGGKGNESRGNLIRSSSFLSGFRAPGE